MFRAAVADFTSDQTKSIVAASAFRCMAVRFLSWACAVAVVGLFAETNPAASGTVPRNALVEFNIPSQPLAAALRAYGKATGLEVFYDGSLSVGRRSTAVMGTYTPLIGLRVLLRGTGYVARETDIANTITIIAGPSLISLRATFDQYQPYFAALQTRLSASLCGGKSGGDANEITFRFWISSLGVISKAELLGAVGDSEDWRREIVSKVQGLPIGKSPPAGLPQPVTMVIYPPSIDDATSCSASGGGHDGN